MLDERDIQLEAYLLWEQAGKPDGMADFFWDLAQEYVYNKCQYGGRLLTQTFLESLLDKNWQG